MKILVVGNGGREHAILWKLRQELPEAELFVTVGNGGTSGLATSIPLQPLEIQALAGWALREKVDLTVVGPEVPLAEGIVDHFTSQGLAIFGPTSVAAELESSKAFSKTLMRRYGIPTAAFEVFTELEAAIEFIRLTGAPIVLKASGLAAGKGAVVCQRTDEAIDMASQILSGVAFGPAGRELVIEEFMTGEELSVFAVCDGSSFITLMPAQDHKTIGEGDVGPNTGGMGAYAPVSIAREELMRRITDEIIEPTLRAMAEEKRPYRGFLYVGVMVTETGPRVVEFNCRFGDPEAQVVIPLLESSLLDLLQRSVDGTLDRAGELRWKSGAAVTTVMASGGYPGDYRKGFEITIPESVTRDPQVVVFHAGTSARGGRLVTDGGRVLSVTAFGETVAEAAERSRGAAGQIEFGGSQFRCDIGWREIART